MNVTLTINRFDISFVIGEFEVGSGKIDGDFIGNYILILGGGGKDNGENQGRNEHCF